MKQIGIVTATDGVKATVAVKRASACESCTGSGVCGTFCKSTMEAKATNAVGAKAGDTVELETASGPVLLYSVLTFIMPVVAGLCGYFTADYLGAGEGAAYITALCALLLSFILLAVITKIRGGRDLEVKITRILDCAK